MILGLLIALRRSLVPASVVEAPSSSLSYAHGTSSADINANARVPTKKLVALPGRLLFEMRRTTSLEAASHSVSLTRSSARSPLVLWSTAKELRNKRRMGLIRVWSPRGEMPPPLSAIMERVGLAIRQSRQQLTAMKISAALKMTDKRFRERTTSLTFLCSLEGLLIPA